MSYRNAVFAKCRECAYDPFQPGTWRQQVADCAGVSCPLFDVRPKPIAKKVPDCRENAQS